MSICQSSSALDTGEIDLFRAVVRQTIQDALGQGMCQLPDQAAAYHLLTSPDLPWREDRETLCSLAGVDEATLTRWSREKLPPQPAPPPLDADAITLLELFADQRTISLRELAERYDMDRQAVRAAVSLCQRNGWTCWLSSRAVYRWDVPETADARSSLSMSPARNLEQKMEAVLRVLDRPMTTKMVGFAASLGDNGVRETLNALVEAGCVSARTMPPKYKITDAGRSAVAVKGGWVSRVLARMIDHGEPLTMDEIRKVAGHRSLKRLTKDRLIARVGSAGDAKAKWFSRTGKQLPPPKPKPEPKPQAVKKPKVAKPPKPKTARPKRNAAQQRALAAVNLALDRVDGEDILAALRQHGPSTLAQLTEQLPISRSLVYRLLVQLEDLGKARREKPPPRVVATAAGRAALSQGRVRRTTKSYTSLVALADAGANGMEVECITGEPITWLRRRGFVEVVGPRATKIPEVWSLVDADQAEPPALAA